MAGRRLSKLQKGHLPPDTSGPGHGNGPPFSGEKDVRQTVPGRSGPGPCFRCGQWGHLKRACAMMECDMAQERPKWDEDEVWQAVAAKGCPAAWILDTYFEGHKWPAMLDSGSSISMVKSHLLPEGLPALCTTLSTWTHSPMSGRGDYLLLPGAAPGHPASSCQATPLPCLVRAGCPDVQAGVGVLRPRAGSRRGIPSGASRCRPHSSLPRAVGQRTSPRGPERGTRAHPYGPDPSRLNSRSDAGGDEMDDCSE